MQQHVKYEVMDLDNLEPYEGNARQHDDAALKTSIKVHGQYRTIVVRQIDGVQNSGGDNPYRYVVLCGHGTAQAMRANGHSKARVEVITCTDEQALQINLMDNRSNDVASYFEDLLSAQLETIRDADMWEGTGWDEKTAAKYLDGKEQQEGEEPAPEGWAIIINCSGEAEQALLLDRFTEEGLDCKALVT